MATYTDLEMYEAVRDASYNLLSKAKTVTIGSRTYTRHDLPELRALEKDYKAQVDAASPKTRTNVARLR